MIDPGQIKALFFDIDGTLARSDTHTIPQSHVESFRLLHEKGYLLFIATGRDLFIHEEEKILEPVLSYLTGFVDVNGQHCALADGTEINSIPVAIRHSIAYTSKDRDNESIVMNQSIRDNICLPSLDSLANKAHLLSDKTMREFANMYAQEMSTKMQSVDQFVSDLSGGNKQKVVLARWIGANSDILVLDSPTRGIDIKVKQDIYQLMDRMRKNGKSIIMISEELMELIGMCDRIIIMKDGKVSSELPRDPNMDENTLIASMV